MKKGTALRFAALIGVLALAAWMPVAQAEAAPFCYDLEGEPCPWEGAIAYCNDTEGNPDSCTCDTIQYPHPPRIRLEWLCDPV
jgi:hypothetical protein